MQKGSAHVSLMLSTYKTAVITRFLLLRVRFQKKFNLLFQIDGKSKGSSRGAIVEWIITLQIMCRKREKAVPRFLIKSRFIHFI